MKSNDDKIWSEYKRRLKEYKAPLPTDMWNGIENRIPKKKHTTLKIFTILGTLLIIAAISVVAFAPERQDDNKKVLSISSSYKQNQNIYKTENVSSQNAKEQLLVVSTQNNNSTKIIDNKTTIQDNADKDNTSQITTSVETSSTMPVAKTVVIRPMDDKVHNSLIVNNNNNANHNIYNHQHSSNYSDTNTKKDVALSDIKNDTNHINFDSLLKEEKLILPNAFYPLSNDERVNTFHPAYKELKNYKMRIFARSGLLIYQTNDINRGWDGKYKGTLMNKGIYIYIIEYTDEQGNNHVQKNPFYLNR